MACQAQSQLETKVKQPTNCKIFAVGLTLRKRNFSPNAPRFHSLSPPPPTGSILFLTTSLQLVFTGLSSADFRWRRKTQTTVITSASARLQRLLRRCRRLPFIRLVLRPPGDFDPKTSTDLVFTQVKTERTIRTMLLNREPHSTTRPTSQQHSRTRKSRSSKRKSTRIQESFRTTHTPT